jgi:hypothetical protein
MTTDMFMVLQINYPAESMGYKVGIQPIDSPQAAGNNTPSDLMSVPYKNATKRIKLVNAVSQFFYILLFPNNISLKCWYLICKSFEFIKVCRNTFICWFDSIRKIHWTSYRPPPRQFTFPVSHSRWTTGTDYLIPFCASISSIPGLITIPASISANLFSSR